MVPDTYEAMLIITSNDPANPSLQLSATMDVTGTVNHAPSIVPPDVLNFDKNGSLSVDFSPYVSDPDSDPLTLQYSGNSNVFVAINGLMVSFSAAQNWTGSELIGFTVSDGSLSASASLTVQVDPVNVPAWNPVVYPNNPATILGIVTFNGIACNLNDVVGVFVGSECRGTAEVVTNSGSAYVTLLANLAANGETIGFKVWDYETQATYPVVETYSVNFGQVLGDPVPLPINAVEFIGPISSIDPSVLAFGEVEAGQSSVLQFTISNSGDQALTGTITTPAAFSVALATGRGNAFQAAQSGSKAQRNALPYSVAPGTSSSFNVSFNPVAAQLYEGSITITGNDPAAPQTSINVSGSGFTYPNLSLDTDHIHAELTYGSTGEASFSIANTGSRVLNYELAESPAVDWLSASPSSGSIAATPQTITLTFSTGTMLPGDYQTTLLITSNDPGEPEAQISVDINIENDLPVLALPEACNFTMTETLFMDFLPYVSDVNGQDLSIGCAGNTNIGVQIDGMGVTFSAVADWYGCELITFWLFDGMDYVYDAMEVTVELVVPEAPVLDPITEVDPDTGVALSWQPVQFATEYQVWRSLEGPLSGFVLIATCSDPSFIDSFTHEKAFYMIKAVNNPITKGGSK